MQIAFEHKTLGNLPEVSLSRFGVLKRDNTRSGLGKRRMILYVENGNEREAVSVAYSLNHQGTIELEQPINNFSGF